MISQMLYLIGAPGVGKSTLARHLTFGWDKELWRNARVPHVALRHPVSGRLAGVELGVPREQFPGTDALAMNIGPSALEFLTRISVPFAFGEGSRLATRPFLGGLVKAGVQLTIGSLLASQELLDARWVERGSKQSPVWRKGALTRAQRIEQWALETPDVTVLRLNAQDYAPPVLADEVRNVFPLIDLRD